ncbi:beta-glucosidase-like SFR2 [Pyrus ussuriensis x Pyrus communis]|uniref:Beta-glucosidase-like SFR2 n=1 Tax=Pyrus ussuriensis x Pyrus communis TaxID=2448454 RepID=A0A5N5FDN0_9ROSA|nr:beta-glucosidase-like SFR2 [Pyrus ussuriensis x Pyrus communis]
MAVVPLFVTATKLAELLVTLTVAANAYSYGKNEARIGLLRTFSRASNNLTIASDLDSCNHMLSFFFVDIFCMPTYCAGSWPSGHPEMLEAATSALPSGVFQQAMHWMAIAHTKVYEYIHEQRSSSKPVVGVAHHKLVETDEFSESGRGVYPDGLYRVLLQFHEKHKHLNVPFMITENGVAHETNLIRRPYLLEHLLAVYAAKIKGVPALGYLFWIISDNWEWAAGNGPKFGLVAVDRMPIIFPGFHVLLTIYLLRWRQQVKLHDDRAQAWSDLNQAAKAKTTQPFIGKLIGTSRFESRCWKSFFVGDL